MPQETVEAIRHPTVMCVAWADYMPHHPASSPISQMRRLKRRAVGLSGGAAVITISSSSFSWLSRCFGAWQRFVQRGTRYRVHVANRQAGTLRMCLQRWVRMKQLRASDGAKVTQLSLCQPKAGEQVAGQGAPFPSHPSKQHYLSSFCSCLR